MKPYIESSHFIAKLIYTVIIHALKMILSWVMLLRVVCQQQLQEILYKYYIINAAVSVKLRNMKFQQKTKLRKWISLNDRDCGYCNWVMMISIRGVYVRSV